VIELRIENPETNEERVLRPGDKLAPPWRVVGMVGVAKPKRSIQRHATSIRTVNVDDKLNKLAALLAIPAADILHTVGRALGINCAYCQLRFQIWKKAEEIGWLKVIYLTARSIKAQMQHDEQAIEAMAKELE
jgi:hypothetical protein